MTRHRAQTLVTRPSVTVVVPCYNYGHFLPRCVEGVLEQPGVDVDVIIVDDCSPDGSGDVAAALAAKDPRVSVVRHAVNQGHIATYNDGLGRATGEYVVLLSADDLLTPGSLARSVALLERHRDVALVYGFPVTFGDEPPPVDTRVTSWSVWDGETWLRRVCARGRNIIVNPEAVMRRSVLQELGGYDADHPHAADMLLWMRAAVRGKVGRVNGPAQAYYREHGANMHSTRFAGVLTDLRESRRVFDVFMAAEDGVADRRRLETRARRALAREALLLASVAEASGEPQQGAGAAELADFAVACRPAVRSTAQWRAYARRSTTGFVPGEARLVTRAHEVRWALRWRRWRRFGT